MGGSWLLLTIVLATIFWLFEVIRARLRHQPPPWKVPREREPTPPRARALWGSDIQLPKTDPGDRRRGLLVVAGIYLTVGVIGTAAALITRAYGGSGGAAFAAAVGAIVAAMMLALGAFVVAMAIRARR